MIKDRRYENNFIHIDFIAKETFKHYPAASILTLTLATDGNFEFQLNDKKYTLRAPFILCLNDNDSFIFSAKSNAAAKTFSFIPTFLNSSLTRDALIKNQFNNIEDMHDCNLITPFFHRNANYNGMFPLDLSTSMQINTWLSIMGTECLSQSDGKWTCRIRKHLLQILYLIEDYFLSASHQKIIPKQPIDYALEYIHTNYRCGLTLDGISQYVGLNRTTLNKQCKEKTGKTIIQYLNHYRIKIAADTLCHTNLNLNEIAMCCGYNYESYFIKIFTERFGISPSEYRKEKQHEKRNYEN